ncbi:MAG: hypothetical protein Q7R60_01600 [bacterium]|nr:hypothetical protein [bacterium]
MGKRFSLETQDERVMGDPNAKKRASFSGGHAGRLAIVEVVEQPIDPLHPRSTANPKEYAEALRELALAMAARETEGRS